MSTSQTGEWRNELRVWLHCGSWRQRPGLAARAREKWRTVADRESHGRLLPLGPRHCNERRHQWYNFKFFLLMLLPVVLWGFCWGFLWMGRGLELNFFSISLSQAILVACCCRLSLFLQCHIVVFENLVMLDVEKSGYRSTQSWIAM